MGYIHLQVTRHILWQQQQQQPQRLQSSFLAQLQRCCCCYCCDHNCVCVDLHLHLCELLGVR